MKLSDLIKDAECDIISTSADIDISSVCSDSEKASYGSLYVCVKGLRHDGHDFIPDAIRNGACAVLAQDPDADMIKSLEESSACLISSHNSRKSLSFILNNFYGHPADGMRLIMTTGTNGKTTVSYMLKEIFSLAGFKTGIIGTLSGNMTTPDPEELYRILSDMAVDQVEFVFMEASSHALALDKLAPLRPDIGIITNITPEHLDFHTSMESYKAAKAKLFDMCRIGFFNMDDPLCCEVAEKAGCRKMFFSTENDSASYIAKNISLLGGEGIVFDFFSHSSLFRIRSNISGMFNVSNALAAASAAYMFGISSKTIKKAFLDFQGVKGRLENVSVPLGNVSVYIDFAHTPDALLNVISAIRGFMDSSKRLVLLFGCGGDRDRLKRPVMGKIATENADFTIITSDNCRTENPTDIIDEILTGIDKSKDYIVIENRRDAICYALQHAKPGDIILLTGKGHEEYEIVGLEKRPFCERDIITRVAYEIVNQATDKAENESKSEITGEFTKDTENTDPETDSQI